ncbi:MAG: hypothetical protein WCJ87_00145 [Burkholderiales bacterium]|jgi:Ni/Co efflux regulator RcnB
MKKNLLIAAVLSTFAAASFAATPAATPAASAATPTTKPAHKAKRLHSAKKTPASAAVEPVAK